MRLILIRFQLLLAAAASMTALAALWRFRPAWPELPDSLSSPVTTAMLQELALFAAWLLAALLIVLLLVQSLRGMRARRPLNLGVTWYATTASRLRRPVDTLGILRPLVSEPRLLVVGPREAPPTTPVEEVVANSPNSPAAVEPEPDARPLISLLGPLTIYGGKRSLRGLRARALELIAFLALRREGAQRDEILEAIWPGEDPKRSRHRLYQAVRDARRLLGEAVASERDRYWLDRSRVRVDVDELEELLGDACQDGRNQRSAESLEKALNLFHAEPLAGCDYAWSESDVRSLRGTHSELLEHVGRVRVERGDARGALEAAERGLTIDVLNEGLWRLALEAEGALGLREAIEERYGRLREILGERLALEPAKETRALYLRLLGQG